MRSVQLIIFFALAFILANCAITEEDDDEYSSPSVAYNPAYENALKKITAIDSLNTALEWKEIKPGLWLSKQGDLGIKENKMIYLDSLLFTSYYITRFSNGEYLKNWIDTATFKYLGNQFYADQFHIYNYFPMAYGGLFRPMVEIDVTTFSIAGSCYAIDKHHVYSEKGEILDQIDRESFFTVAEAGCFAKDKDGYYFWGDKIEENEMDDTYFEYIQILEDAANKMDTIYSEKPVYALNPLEGTTKINFGDFKVKIDGGFETRQSDDTAYVSEWVGEYLYGRQLTIQSKNNKDTFHVFIQSIDWITEMMESDSIGYLHSWDNWDPLQIIDTSDRFYWKPTSKKNTYLFPNIGYHKSQFMQTRIKELVFKDTSYWYHGEMSGNYLGDAWIYQGKIVNYWIYTAIITIERHNHGRKSKKWLQVEFSYGC